MSDEIVVNCWIRGNPQDAATNFFAIRLQRDGNTVRDLQQSIQDAESFVNVQDKDRKITLRRLVPPLPIDLNLPSSLANPATQSLNPRQAISACFPQPNHDPLLLHVIVDPAFIELIGWMQHEASSRTFTVSIAPNKDVSALKELIKKRRAVKFKEIDSDMINLYNVSVHKDANLEKNLYALKYGDPMDGSTKLSEIFTFAPPSNHVHFVVGQPDVKVQAMAIVQNLRARNSELFNCLKIKVKSMKTWSQDDVKNNLGDGQQYFDYSRNIPTVLTKIEQELSIPRTYAPSPDARESVELRLSMEWTNEFSIVYKQVIPDEGTQAPTVQNKREFVAFNHILRCYVEDASDIQNEGSSSLKASTFTVSFILPAFFSDRTNGFRTKYVEQIPWKFPLFLQEGAEPDAWRKYTPKNDFMVYAKSHFVPLVVSEVYSQTNQSDRWRMLVEATALARAGRFLMMGSARDDFFVVAVYLTGDLVAERYVVMQIDTQGKVSTLRKDFRLLLPTEAVAFFLEMCNLSTKLEELCEKIDDRKNKSLTTIAEGAKGLISMSTRVRTPSSTHDTLGPIPEEGNGGGPEDDLGVFAHRDIQGLLRGSGYNTRFRPHLSDDVAVATSKEGGSVYLKYADNRSKEVEILQQLQGIGSPQNHTISIIHSWEVQGGTVISMHNAGGWLTSLKHDGEQQLWQVARQLFEAIGFLHENGVAHMDIKPQNVIIPPEGGKLTIIDFSCSVRVDRPNHMFKGVAGTEGYIAPEVRVGKYSPMLADLWSCGKTLEDLCLCRTRTAPSVECTILLKMAEELMAAEPRQRPKMSDLLDRMKEEEERGTVKIQKSEENVETMEGAESVESVESMNSVESVESTESMEDMESTDRMSYPEPSSISSVSVQPIPLCATVQA